MKNLITTKRCFFAAFGFFVLMVLLGSIPGNRQVLDQMATAKVWHFGAYGFLSVAIFLSLKYPLLKRVVITLLAIALLGGVDETIQSFLPYRAGKIEDWYFDVLTGIVCMSALTIYMKAVGWRAKLQMPDK